MIPAALIIPEAIEAIRRQLRVLGSMLDILVPQVMLDSAGVLAVVRQLEAGGVPQHVGMDGQAQSGRLARAGHQFPEGGISHGCLAFGDEHIRGLGVIPPELAQCPEFGTA